MVIRPSMLTAILAAVVACADGSTNPPTDGDTALVVLPAALTLAIDEPRALAAFLVIAGADTTTVDPTWTSRDIAIATVSAAGVVTGVTEGATQIVATIYGLRDSAAVTVSDTILPPPALQRIASGLAQPVFLTAAPGDPTRLFVVEKTGAVRILRNDTLLTAPFVDIGTLVSRGSEQGLLSLAFHPDYGASGYVFLSYTDTFDSSKVVRYHATGPETLDPASAVRILSVAQPYTNHNGGLIAFGPDGMLYVGLGDGGSGGDPQGNGQNTATLLGSILRLDVDGAAPYIIPPDNPLVGQSGSRGEIWVYGLRNPWRFSFDRVTHDLYIGDVGQNTREEVDVQAAGSAGGENYGWNIMEGSICYNAATCQTQGLVLPVAEYTHAEGCSITGGYVYRGTAVRTLQGRYLYADYCGGWVRSFTYAGGVATDARDWPDLSPGPQVTSFGEDGAGELYVMTQDGDVYRIVPVTGM
jgi:glucose/arabinose dehydrogenase